MKSIVVYYSRSGNTGKVADRIASRFSSDILFVEPEEQYGNYVSSLIRMKKEQSKGCNTKIKTKEADLTSYDIVFIGFPVWAGIMPSFMQEYLKKCKIDGAKVIPFATAGSNGKISSLNHVKTMFPECHEDLFYYTNLFKHPDVNEWLDIVERSVIVTA